MVGVRKETFTCLTIFQTKTLNVKGVMLKLAFAIMRPAMPCWDEEVHSLHIEKRLKDRVFPCCDLESTPNVVH
jgi:hypothetical protein